MTKQYLIDMLNGDLMREYQHLHTYLHYATVVRGLHRAELSEFFMEEATSELKHCEEFARMIVGLGGKPRTPWTTTKTNTYAFIDIPQVTDPYDCLREVLRMEEEVVAKFAKRMKTAEEYGGVDGSVLHVFYENQILDSRLTVNHVREMLK